MNESSALDGVGSLSMETSRLLSITQRWDAGLLAGDRIVMRNTAALSILLGGLCTGIITLLVFMGTVCIKKNTRSLTVFRLSLVVNGLLQSLSTPVVAMNLLGSSCSLSYCMKLFAVWYASRHCGVLLYLLVVLEFLWGWSGDGKKIVPLYLSVPVVLTLNLICILFFEVREAAVAFGAIAMTLTLAMLILAGCSNRKDKRLFIVVFSALVIFGGTYCPGFAYDCMILDNQLISLTTYYIFLCLTSLRLVLDGFLYRMIFRETPEETPEPPRAAQMNLYYIPRPQM